MPVKQKSRRSGLDEADKEQASVEIRSWLETEKTEEKKEQKNRTRKSLEFGPALAVIHYQLASSDSRGKLVVEEREVETDLLPPQLIFQEVDVTSEERQWRGEAERNQTLDGTEDATGRW